MKSSPTVRISLGIIALNFFAAHAVTHIRIGDPASMLWACHIATFMIGIGSLFARLEMVVVGTLWLCVGVPLWLVYLAGGGELLFTSALTHLGGLALGWFLLIQQPVPKGSWWRALIALVGLMLLCRLVTGTQDNVNLVFRIHGQKTTSTGSLILYLLILLSVSGTVFWTVETLHRRLVRQP